MTLYEANQLVRRLDEQYRESGQSIPVTLQIDFLANGQPDRYQIAPSLGSGEGSILSHMKQNVVRFLQNAQRTNEMFEDVPAQYRDTMQAQFTAFADRAAMHVSQKLIPYFETHCTLCAMRARRAPEIEAAPGMAAYAEAYYKQIDELCKTLNDSPLGEMEPEPAPPEREEPPARSEAVEPEPPAPPEESAPPPLENKQSVRGWLAQCKQESRMEFKDASRNKQDRER